MGHEYCGGIVKTRCLVTDIYPISDWPEAFDKFEKQQGLKIVLQPLNS